MNELDSTLLVLNHFYKSIKSRTDYCNRNKDFDVSQCITAKMTEKIKLGFAITELKNEPIITQISRECADIRLFLHSYMCLNIIDMFSFDHEYNDFFNPNKFIEESIKDRIDKVKIINKNIRKELDWKQLKKFRNQVLAHNLRDKNNSNKIAENTFKEIGVYLNDISLSIKYFEVVLKLYENIHNEFEVEILEALKKLSKK